MEFSALDALSRPNPTIRDLVVRNAAWYAHKANLYGSDEPSRNQWRVIITIGVVDLCNIDCVEYIMDLTDLAWDRLIADVRCAKQWADSGEWVPE